MCYTGGAILSGLLKKFPRFKKKKPLHIKLKQSDKKVHEFKSDNVIDNRQYNGSKDKHVDPRNTAQKTRD